MNKLVRPCTQEFLSYFISKDKKYHWYVGFNCESLEP